MYLQTKPKPGGEWKAIEQIELGRDYSLFDLLSNVRGNQYTPIVEPRSMEVTPVIRDEHTYDIPIEFGKNTLLRCSLGYDDPNTMYVGDHSFSVLTLDDLLKYKHYKDIDDSTYTVDADGTAYYLSGVIGRLIIKLLANTNRQIEARYIIGYDS